MAALEAIAMQQRQIKQLQENMSSMRIDIEDVKTKTNTNESSIKAISGRHPGQHNQTRNNKQQPNRRSAETPQNQTDKIEPKQGGDRATSDAQQDAAGTPNTPEQNTYAGAVQVQLDSSDGFSKQAKRPNKGTNRVNNSATKKSGKGETSHSDILKGGPETFQVQITNVNSALDAEKIREYITSKDVDVTKVEDTSSNDWDTKRFLLTFDYSVYDKVMESEFWPKRIFFRRWFPARVKKAQ